ncbi:MAG TPA: DUF4430 domain-containing protein [Patescibacteria group bacterium]|nr:DUF4430 domain-containing protein [Patescibacteria group bacterium]
MKTFKFVIIAVVFFVAGFLLGQSYQIPPLVSINDSGQELNLEPINYVLRFSDNNLTEYQNIVLTEKSTVLDLLKKITEENGINLKTQDYENLGTLVTAIGDKENGQENKYWQYLVDGQMPQVGAASFLLSGGENVEWSFMEFEDQSL